jgi:nitroreductase
MSGQSGRGDGGSAGAPRTAETVDDRAAPGPHFIVDAAITSRRAVRAFLPDPVPRATIEDILRVASRAPSGTNTQPWSAIVLTGAALQRLSRAILEVYGDAERARLHHDEYAYYPRRWVDPYLTRRRKVGWGLYGLLGIGRDDTQRMHEQLGRNYVFFDAPVGIIFTIDRALEQGSWLDYGMFLQNVMVAARARGLDTCPQAAFIRFHQLIRQQLDLPEDRVVVCGMSLGRADMSRIENTLATEREPVENFVQFRDR